jgi:hypothetical protein
MVMSETEFQAGLRYGRERGVDNIWSEREFVRDVQRLEAERGINVKTLSRKLRLHLAQLQSRPAAGRLTRFGRATFTKVYA